MQMFTSARYSGAHYLLHAVPPVSANAYMHFERNFLHGHVQLLLFDIVDIDPGGSPQNHISLGRDRAERGRDGTRRDRRGRGGAGRDRTGQCGTRRAGQDGDVTHRRQHEGLQHKLRHGAPPAV